MVRPFAFWPLAFAVWLTSVLGAEDLAAPLAGAQAALREGDYARSYAAFRRIAEAADNPLAAFNVGLFYQFGWGRAVDAAEACRWFERAAAGEIPVAQHNLGDCLVAGTHRSADPATAAVWYDRAARNGHLLSLCSLAELYTSGTGVQPNPDAGIALCRQAAEQGLTPAMIRLGRLLVEIDPAEAHSWFARAAERGAPEAQYQLGILNRHGIGRPADVDTARYWFESAAAQGYAPAYWPTAQLYLQAPADPATGRLPARALAKAYLWLSATAAHSAYPAEQARAAARLEELESIMPGTWKPALDAKVARHLETHAAEKAVNPSARRPVWTSKR
ncbi:MAG: sel1 repeat family protein, partial [Chloroflexi bacterium]|nr:sel1 repeat family protein [Chloroflexota bacterium]